MPHSHKAPADVWSVEGRFQHWVFSPKGGIEGLVTDTDGVLTQFYIDPQDAVVPALFNILQFGQALVLEGIAQAASPKAEGEHVVYNFVRLVSIEGKDTNGALPAIGKASGTVVRFNYAKHGEVNGVVLDTGDFVHTKPDGFRQCNLKIGDKVTAEGRCVPLMWGSGRVMEVSSVNGKPVGKAR